MTKDEIGQAGLIVWILMIGVGVAACGWRGAIVGAASFIVGMLTEDCLNEHKAEKKDSE